MDRAKSRFTANVHHELRTPLTLILAPLEALRAGEYGDLGPGIQSTLRTMHVNGRRLLKLINNLLDLAKLECQQFEVRRRPVEAGRLVEDVVLGARPLAERKGLELAMRLDEALPPLHADSEALDKVLVNLVGNALKFTPSGGRVTVEAAPSQGGTLLRVVDTGVGIPPDALSRVFDRFAQVDGSTTRRHEGTGIGLSLTAELVQLHGGRVWAESEGEGQGTTMCVWLPEGESDLAPDEEVLRDDEGHAFTARSSMAAAESELNLEGGAGGSGGAGGEALADVERTVARWESEQPGAAEAAAGAPEGAPEIVVAEDNPDMRALLVFLLGREYRVRPARNGREALEAVRERLPALVLTDVMMPEMSGTELCSALKEDPQTRNVPVVIVTSKAESEMKIEGLERGADDYLTKPFHPRELLARVRGLVRVRQLQEELEAQNQELARALGGLRQAQVALVQNERLAAVGELAAGIAHEVNNPVNYSLNAVRTLGGVIEELVEVVAQVESLEWDEPEKLAAQLPPLQEAVARLGAEELPATVSELAEIIGEGLQRTASLVGDLRDFAAPGRGSRSGVDLGAGLRSTLQLLRSTLAAKGVHVALELPGDLPTPEGDPGALNQVFLNLIKNAAEAFPEGGGSLVISATALDGSVELRFRDDGPGISPEVAQRLFEPFVTTKSAGEGTGLGLSISRQIAEAHGGSLEAHAPDEGGTCFVLRLPLAQGVPPAGG